MVEDLRKGRLGSTKTRMGKYGNSINIPEYMNQNGRSTTQGTPISEMDQTSTYE